MSIHILSAACTDIGPRKEVNQDSYFYAVAEKAPVPAGIFAVADGVSGSAHGEVASRICVEAVERWWQTSFPALQYDKSRAVPALAGLLDDVNKTVCDTLLPDGGRSSSTLTLLLLLDDQWFTYNVGDSRIYRLRRGFASQIDQITEDQSCLVEREFNGQKYLKSVLTSCIGGRNAFKYGYSSGPLREGDRFLLCSDGVYRSEKLRQLKKILNTRSATPLQISEMLVKNALGNGETDNITAITVFC